MVAASSTVQTKRRTTGAAGPPSSLLAGETFHNETESVLYIGIGNNGSGVATSIISFAGVGAFVDRASAQTIAGTKTFSSPVTAPSFVGTLDIGTDNPASTNGVFGVGTATQTSYDLGMMSDPRAAVSDLGLLSQAVGTAIDLGLFSS